MSLEFTMTRTFTPPSVTVISWVQWLFSSSIVASTASLVGRCIKCFNSFHFVSSPSVISSFYVQKFTRVILFEKRPVWEAKCPICPLYHAKPSSHHSSRRVEIKRRGNTGKNHPERRRVLSLVTLRAKRKS